MGDVFDNVSQAQQPSGAVASPGAPPAQPNDVFSQVAGNAADKPAAPATISAVPEPKTFSERAERWADNVAHDLKYGTDLTGVGSLLKKMGAHGVYAGNPEAVGDFMASMPLGILRAGKGAAELPQSGKRWQGTKDVAGGALEASTIPAAFVAPEAGETAASGAGKAVESAGKAVESARGAISKGYHAVLDEKSLQPVLQKGIREVLGKAADENEVAKPAATSIRDVAADVGNAIYAKSKSLYRQLDEATGGRFQRFDEALQNINKKLRDIVGVDDGQEAALMKQKEHYEKMQDEAFELAKKKGVDPKLITEAKANWKKSQALYDADYQIKKATGGMRPNVGSAERAAKNPEAVDPIKFFTRVNNLYDSGRLQDALGEEGADRLLQHANEGMIRYKQIVRNRKVGTALAKGALYGAGLYGAGHAVGGVLNSR